MDQGNKHAWPTRSSDLSETTGKSGGVFIKIQTAAMGGGHVPGFLSVVALSRDEGWKREKAHNEWVQALAVVEAGLPFEKLLWRLKTLDKEEQVAARGGFTGFSWKHKGVWKRHVVRRDRAYWKHKKHEQRLLEKAVDGAAVDLDSGRAEGSQLRLTFRF